MEEMIDITPPELGGKGLNQFVFQEDDWKMILENPGGLTREGCIEKVKLWEMSSNSINISKFRTMLERCKNFQPSGLTSDGKVILSRDIKGVPRWVKENKNIEPKSEVRVKNDKKN